MTAAVGQSRLEIRDGGLEDPRVIALLEAHLRLMQSQSPPESAHALTLSGLKTPDIQFWSVWEGEDLLAVGALKRLGAGHGEVKSMHTAQTARRRGIASMMVKHIIAVAQSTGLSRLSLETGSMDVFEPARSLYRRHGFRDCRPFGDYRPDPNSAFLTIALTPDKGA